MISGWFIFSFLTPLLIPIIDGTLLYAILTDTWELPMQVAAIFLLVDLAYHAFGLMREPRKLAYLPLIPVQRLFYRLALSFITLKSLLYAIEGTRAYWAAQLRTGAAHAFFVQRNTGSNS